MIYIFAYFDLYRFRTQGREKSSWQGKIFERKGGKRTKKCLEEEIADGPFENNINTVVSSHQKFYMLMLLSMNDKVSSFSSQIVEQIEVTPEVVLSEVFKLIDSVISKRQRDQSKQFSLEKKDSMK